MKFSQTEYYKKFTHPLKEQLLKFTELMYGKDSQLLNIQEPTERRSQALAKAKIIDEEAMNLKEPKIREFVSEFMTFQHHNKVWLLHAKQELFRQAMDKIMQPLDASDEDERLKLVELKGKLDALADKLVPQIEGLYSEIWGDPTLQESAKEQMRLQTPEERIRAKKIKV